MRDPLSGAWLRAKWDDLVQEVSSRSADRAHDAWVALIDIDRFKSFNMHNGHLAGDQALVKLATCLLSLESGERIEVVRTGGQEFALVCLQGMNADDHDGYSICERVLIWARDSLTPEQLEHCGDPHCVGPTQLTVSIALGRIEPGESPAAVRERLDSILLRAKLAGRDRIESG